MSLSREPARPHDPGYPTFSEFDPGRRAALRAIGLAGLSAVGLNLVGCPGGGGTGTPTTGTGSGPATDTGTPKPDTDWVPWRETETGPLDRPHDIPLGGAPPPSDWNRPVAIVVGGGPISVTFSDGVTSSLAVALVVQPNTTPEAVKADAPEHTAAVRAAAKALPGSTLDSAEGIAALEAKIQEEVLKAVPGLVIEGVQAAPAVPDAQPDAPEPEPSRSSAPAPSAPAPPPPSAPAPAPSPAPPAGGVAATSPVKTGRAPLRGKAVWVPCGKPGCTSCGKK